MSKTLLTGPQRPMVSIPFMLLGMLFCVCLIAANLLETKQVTLGPLDPTAGLIVFPVSYIINDCLVEVWGYRRTRPIIWLGFFMNFLFVLFGLAADALPGAPYWQGEQGFHEMFGLAPRIAGASFLAFLVGSFLNAYVMSRMKLQAKTANTFRCVPLHRLWWAKRPTRWCSFRWPWGCGALERHAVAHGQSVVLKTVYEIIAPATNHPHRAQTQKIRRRRCLRQSHFLQPMENSGFIN